MTAPNIIPGIINSALLALPSILALVREQHAAAHPDAPPLTDAEVFAGLTGAITDSGATDDAWERATPSTSPTPADGDPGGGDTGE